MASQAASGRLAVALGAVSAAVHGVLAVDAWDRSAVTAALLVAMAVGCLACAPSLWRGGTVHAWMTMLGLTGVMLYAHWALCFACGPTVHHTAGRSDLATAALVLMAAEMAVATAAVIQLIRSSPNKHHNPTRENDREVALP